jgi:hypothetical protein
MFATTAASKMADLPGETSSSGKSRNQPSTITTITTTLIAGTIAIGGPKKTAERKGAFLQILNDQRGK